MRFSNIGTFIGNNFYSFGCDWRLKPYGIDTSKLERFIYVMFTQTVSGSIGIYLKFLKWKQKKKLKLLGQSTCSFAQVSKIGKIVQVSQV